MKFLVTLFHPTDGFHSEATLTSRQDGVYSLKEAYAYASRVFGADSHGRIGRYGLWAHIRSL